MLARPSKLGITHVPLPSLSIHPAMITHSQCRPAQPARSCTSSRSIGTPRSVLAAPRTTASDVSHYDWLMAQLDFEMNLLKDELAAAEVNAPFVQCEWSLSSENAPQSRINDLEGLKDVLERKLAEQASIFLRLAEPVTAHAYRTPCSHKRKKTCCRPRRKRPARRYRLTVY